MKKILCLLILAILMDINIFSQENTNKKTDDNKTEKIEKEVKEKIFSIGLYSSVDSIKTSVNIEFGFPIVRFSKFEIRSLTSIVGYKMFDSEDPELYMIGLSEKISFGDRKKDMDGIQITKYGFSFFSIGVLGFKANKSHKYLFSMPLFYEIGGGAGFNIFVTKHLSILLEFGGGLNKVIGDNDYPKNIASGSFGRISAGTKYYF